MIQINTYKIAGLDCKRAEQVFWRTETAHLEPVDGEWHGELALFLLAIIRVRRGGL